MVGGGKRGREGKREREREKEREGEELYRERNNVMNIYGVL